MGPLPGALGAGSQVGNVAPLRLKHGALLSLIVNDVLPPHVVQGVFNMLVTGTGRIAGFGGGPLVVRTSYVGPDADQDVRACAIMTQWSTRQLN
jgi:hypothetical protein